VADWPPDYPDEDDANVGLGRFIQEYSYPRERKELLVGHSKMDVFRNTADFLFVEPGITHARKRA